MFYILIKHGFLRTQGPIYIINVDIFHLLSIIIR